MHNVLNTTRNMRTFFILFKCSALFFLGTAPSFNPDQIINMYLFVSTPHIISVYILDICMWYLFVWLWCFYVSWVFVCDICLYDYDISMCLGYLYVISVCMIMIFVCVLGISGTANYSVSHEWATSVGTGVEWDGVSLWHIWYGMV